MKFASFLFILSLMISGSTLSKDGNVVRRDIYLDFEDVSSLVEKSGKWLNFGRYMPMRTVMVFDEKGRMVLGIWSRRDDPLTQSKMDASMKQGAVPLTGRPTRDEVIFALNERSNNIGLKTAAIPRRTIVEIEFPVGVCAPCAEMSEIVESAIGSSDDVQWLRVGFDHSASSIETSESLPSSIK